MAPDSVGARVAAVFRPSKGEQEMPGFKTPSRMMAATITLVLLTLFAMSYIAPYLKVSWINPDTKPDPALQQNLLMLLAISVAYYIGSSKGSAEANDTIRSQVASAPPTPPPSSAPALQIAPVTDGGVQATVKIDDSTPIKVEEVVKP